MQPREGKPPLLKGDPVIKLQNGVASISRNIKFTDNSCWRRTKMFRLGVKIVGSNSVRADIKEGRSNPFKVLDKRGEAYKKHDRPSVNNDVWRLRGIGKGGPIHKELSKNDVKTVKDLLRLNTTGSLREKFGNNNTWDKIIAHAKYCELDDEERYFYSTNDQSEPLILILNCIYEVVEVNFSGQNCSRSLQSLNPNEKRLVERVKQEAYNNLKDLKPTAETTTLAAPYGAPDQGRQVVPEEAYVNGANGINGLALPQTDSFDFASLFAPDYFNQLEQLNCSLLFGEGASCSNGRSKKHWQKIRNAHKYCVWLKGGQNIFAVSIEDYY
ncbi:Calmodulin-binding protein 60 G [Spatholobus suberectus]|nr:Calmodulin-binding protein 60 G [Spatholobus suberectus]